MVVFIKKTRLAFQEESSQEHPEIGLQGLQAVPSRFSSKHFIADVEDCDRHGEYEDEGYEDVPYLKDHRIVALDSKLERTSRSSRVTKTSTI